MEPSARPRRCFGEGFSCPPPFVPPATSGDGGGGSLLASILIAVVITVAFALALVLYFILASRFCPNHVFLFFFPLGRGRGRRGVFPGRGRAAAGTASLLPCVSRGLDESLIGLIPVATYAGPEAGLVDATECVVCLGEFRQGDVLRVLPKCSHAFHLPCVDKWLRAHTTCPMCRAVIVNPNPANVAMAMAIALSARAPGAATMPTQPTQPSNGHDETTRNLATPHPADLKRSFSERLWMQERAKPNTSSSSSSSSSCSCSCSCSSNHDNDEKVLGKSRSLSMVSSWRSKGGDTTLTNKNILGRVFSSTSKNTPTSSTLPNDDVPPL